MRTSIAAFALLAALPAWGRPPLVDVHVHADPRRYALALDVLAATGVTRFVNLSGGTAGDGLEGNLAAAAAFEGRIVVCTNLRWRDHAEPDFVERQVALLSQAAHAGARCLKIQKALGLGVPDFGRPEGLMTVDDPRLDPIWATAGGLGLPVFIHTGDPKAFFEPLGPSNERMDELGVHPEWSFADPRFPRLQELLDGFLRVVSRHPHTTFIGVHFGNYPEDIEWVGRALDEHPNLYVDVAARLPEIGRHPPETVRSVFLRHQDRILFGTDLGFTNGLMLGSVGRTRPGLPDLFLFYADHFRWFESRDRAMPHPTPIQGGWTIDGVGLPEPVLRKIYAENALRLLWGEAGIGPVDAAALREAPPLADYFP